MAAWHSVYAHWGSQVSQWLTCSVWIQLQEVCYGVCSRLCHTVHSACCLGHGCTLVCTAEPRSWRVPWQHGVAHEMHALDAQIFHRSCAAVPGKQNCGASTSNLHL
jgi:hypothetical protein